MKFKMLLCVAVVAIGCGAAGENHGGKIQWNPGKDYDATLAQAKTAGVPVLVYFTGEG